MNYHQLTMNEPRDSPARRKQFLVICTVIVFFLIYTATASGGFTPVHIQHGIFPGGDYIYKYTLRDYAASMSLQESIGKDVNLKPREFADKLYTVYLDDPRILGGRRQRFAAGYLITESHEKPLKQSLLSKNANRKPPTEVEILTLGAAQLWPRLEYRSQSLPSVNCAVVNFPFTNGFVSALIHTWKVIPALRQHAEKYVNNKDVVVITTCSIRDQMCTHSTPLHWGRKFLLGQPNMEKYVSTLGPEDSLFDLRGIGTKLSKFCPPLRWVGLV